MMQDGSDHSFCHGARHDAGGWFFRPGDPQLDQLAQVPVLCVLWYARSLCHACNVPAAGTAAV